MNEHVVQFETDNFQLFFSFTVLMKDNVIHCNIQQEIRLKFTEISFFPANFIININNLFRFMYWYFCLLFLFLYTF